MLLVSTAVLDQALDATTKNFLADHDQEMTPAPGQTVAEVIPVSTALDISHLPAVEDTVATRSRQDHEGERIRGQRRRDAVPLDVAEDVRDV